MLRVFAWMGLGVGTPSVATWVSSIYFPVDHFMVFFVLSVGALLIGLLPQLAEAPRSLERRDDS